jgi:hypothetical protein
MGLKEDLPILVGLVLILGTTVYAVGTTGLPGIGDFDNPLEIPSDTDEPSEGDVYDLTGQYTVGAYAGGGVYVNGFTYQTQKSCTLCLSIGDLSFGDLSYTGANNVRTEINVVNKDTGRTVLSTTKFLGEVSGTEDKLVSFEVNNLKPGNYRVMTTTYFEPKYFDLNFDGEVERDWNVEIPKEVRTS